MIKSINKFIYRRKVKALPLEERKRYDPKADEVFDLEQPPKFVRYQEGGPLQDGLPSEVKLVLHQRNGLMSLIFALMGGLLSAMGILGESDIWFHTLTLGPGLLLLGMSAFHFFGRYKFELVGNEMRFSKGLFHLFGKAKVQLHRIERISYLVTLERNLSASAFSGSEYDSDGFPTGRNRNLIFEDDKAIYRVKHLRYSQLAFLRQVLELHVRNAYRKYGKPKTSHRQTQAHERDMRFQERQEWRGTGGYN